MAWAPAIMLLVCALAIQAGLVLTAALATLHAQITALVHRGPAILQKAFAAVTPLGLFHTANINFAH